MADISENKVNEELGKVGVIVNDIFDLVNSNKPYPNAIPVLINLLKEGISNDVVKEGVIRALAVKEAKGKAGEILIEEYKKTPKDKIMLLWVIGNTMEVVISENEIENILEIVQNKSNGMSRQMFVSALGKVKSDKVEQVLMSLLEDEELAPFALDALGKLKSKRAKNKISDMLNNKNPLIRKEALKALKKISQ